MQTALNSTLAAKFSLHQDKQLSQADAMSNRLERKLEKLWAEIMRLLSSPGPITSKRFALRDLLFQVVVDTHGSLADGLGDMTTSSYQDAVTVLGKTVPLGHLGLIAEKKPVLEDSGNEEEIRRKIKDSIFAKLPKDKVDQIVKGTTAGMSWQGRIAQQTRLGNPDHLATMVTSGFAAGATPADLAKQIRPFVQDVASTARRVARNESMRIAHETRMAAYEELGDMVVGYQIHATMDTRVRPEHAARSGNIYYKKPTSGQLGMDKMPRPPLEEDGTVAHGCRCWLTPVLEVQKHIEENPAAKAVFTNARGKLVPNPAVYTDWFHNAPPKDQQRVVGARRMHLLKKMLPNEKITWGHFVDPDSGRLMDEEELHNETPQARQKRLIKFNDLIAKRKELTQKVANYGYLPPEPLGPVPVVAPVIVPPPKPLPKPVTVIATPTGAVVPPRPAPAPQPVKPKPVPLSIQSAEAHFAYNPKDARRFIAKTPGKGDTALRKYIGTHHLIINDVLRTGKKDKYARRVIRRLDKAMVNLSREIPAGTILYRAMPDIDMGPADKGFMSTSLSLDVSRKDFGGVDKFGNPKKVYKITVVSPIKGIYIPALLRQQAVVTRKDRRTMQEEEILLPRGMKLGVTGVQYPDGTWEAYI